MGPSEQLEWIKRFCGKEKSFNYRIKEPAVYGGYLYATDGRILIRMPCDGPNTPDDQEKKFPDMSGFFKEFPAVEEIIAKDDTKADCSECGGDGKTSVDCVECRGTGDVFCPTCEGEMNCKACGGNGFMAGSSVCPACNGEGGGMRGWFGNRLLDWQYRRMLEALPGLKCQTSGAPGDNMYFMFGGGDGIIAPMRTEANKRRKTTEAKG